MFDFLATNSGRIWEEHFEIPVGCDINNLPNRGEDITMTTRPEGLTDEAAKDYLNRIALKCPKCNGPMASQSTNCTKRGTSGLTN